MYKDGVPLSEEAIEEGPSHTGNFILEEEKRAGHPVIRRARLLHLAPHLSYDIMPPLLEPELVKADNNEMQISGYYYHFNIAACKQLRYKQCWSLRQIKSE